MYLLAKVSGIPGLLCGFGSRQRKAFYLVQQKIPDMKKNHAWILLLFLSSLAQSQTWTSLFDGKSLKGWKQLNGQARYRVENNQIVGTTVANTPNSFLATEIEYGDFILELELKVDNSMNSGIQIRSLSLPSYKEGRVHGYQVEIDPSDRAWSGGIYDEARRDWLYIPDINPEGKKAFKKDQWNKYRIEAIGPVIRTWINDIPVACLVDDLTLKGFIALQVHSIGKDQAPGTEIRWRNIRIQTSGLKPRPYDQTPVVNLMNNHLSEMEKNQGFKLLFNGNDFNGWRKVHQTGPPEKRWSVKEGMIGVMKSDGSETGNDIVTTDQYGAFELTFDFKLTEGANSGLKYFVDEQYDSGGRSGIGLEYQVLDDARHPDAKQGVVGNRTLSSLYDLIPATPLNSRFQRKIGDWNQGRIIVYPNNMVQHWLNGFKVVEYERNSNIFKALVARSKYAVYPGFASAAKGHILLQDHGDEVWFRNIKLRTLE